MQVEPVLAEHSGIYFYTMEREIKGIWIPIEIWEASDLSWNEKILLMEVDSFTSQEKDCYFSNDYIAELLGIKPDTASKMVSSLIRKGYIRQVRFDGRKRYLASCISIRCRVGLKSDADYDENHTQPRRNIIDNNISNKPGNKISSKEDNNIYNPKPQKFDFRKALLSAGVEPEVADAWMQVRKVKKAVNTEIAWKAIEKEIAKAARTANECIRCAVEHSWSGFKAEWCETATARITTPGTERNAGKPRQGEAGYMDRARAAAIELGIEPFNPYE